jgi:hypothetical protein
LTQKIIRQPAPSRSPSTNSPPMIGPSTALPPITGPNSPKAFWISSGGKVERISPKPCGIMTAANSPWASRKAISISGDVAAPHSADIKVKPATPIRNRRRRAKMSPNRPPVTRPTANVRA